MIELVEYIAKSLVDNVDGVRVLKEEDEEGNIDIVLKVSQEDMGKIIGKQGKIAKSIRDLLKAISLKENIRINLKIEELNWQIQLVLERLIIPME